MVNHLLRKGYLSELEDYLSELEGKPEIKLGNRDKQFLQSYDFTNLNTLPAYIKMSMNYTE